ncbi:MAG: hypothetical protein AB8B66_02165 [Rickettsiaceae bacterium]
MSNKKRVWDNIAALNYQLDEAEAKGKVDDKYERNLEIAKT